MSNFLAMESTKAALNRYYAREAKASLRRPRKNEKPEFEFKKVALAWLAENRFDVNVVESKAVYNFASGRYDHGQTEAGFSDIVGVTPYFGVAAFIELKAPGRRGTLKPHQRDFLVAKLNKYAFAVCVDAVNGPHGLSTLFIEWSRLRRRGMLEEARLYLWMKLPKVKELTDNLADITG